jgi:hypothetical protein
LLEEHRKTVKIAALAIPAIIFSAFLTSTITPDNYTGRLVTFSVPLAVGIIFGAKIYFRELRKLEEKLD